MALTRITTATIGSNVISADKMQNAAIQARHFQSAAITLDLLDANANVAAAETRVNANLDIVQDNVASGVTNLNTVHANVVAAEANVVLVRSNVDSLGAFANTNLDTKANVSATFIQLNANLNTTSTNVAAVISNATSFGTYANTNLDTKANVSATLFLARANDFVTFTLLNANVNTVQDNVANIIDGTTPFSEAVTMQDDLTVQGNLTVAGNFANLAVVDSYTDDRMIMLANAFTGSPSLDVGLLFNRGNQGNAAFFYDESARTFKLSDTKDPSSNTSLSPVSAANLDVGIITSASLVSTAITQNGATLDNLISSNVDGAISTVNDTNLTASRALASDGSGKIVVSDVTSTELGYLDGVTSAIQTQFTGAETRRTNNIAGAISTVTTSDLTASRAVISGTGGKIEVSAVTSTEVGYLDGVTSAIQTQINDLESRRNANVGVAAANDFVTFTRVNANLNTTTDNVTALETRVNANLDVVQDNVAARNTQLNANIDVVQDNVAALSGGAILLTPFNNVNTSTGTSNVFFLGKPVGTPANVLYVAIDGVVQTKDVPGVSNNDYVVTVANNTIAFTDTSIPSGLTITTQIVF